MERRGAAAALVLVAVLAGLLLPAAASADQHPQLEGRSLDESLALLDDAGLDVELDPDPLPEGVDRSLVVVVRQSPLEDPAAPDSPSLDRPPSDAPAPDPQLTGSPPPESPEPDVTGDGHDVRGWILHLGAAVPDLTGRSLAQAQAELEPRGLAARTSSVDDPDGVVVVAHAPGPDALLELGEAVELTVVPGVRVPDVVGLARAEAARAVESLNLVFSPTDAESSPGVVESQEPPAGALVAPGTRVRVRLAAPPTTLVVVPDLRGSSVEEARRLLLEAGLTLETTVEGDPGEARLVSQDPAAGTRVLPASVVAARFEVPDDPGVGRALLWSLLAAAALLGSACGAVLWRLVRRARERTWVRQNVTCRGIPGDVPAPRVDRPDADLCLAVRVDVHPDPGHQELQEVRP